MGIDEFYKLKSFYSGSNVRLDAPELPINDITDGLDISDRLLYGIYKNINFPIKFKVGEGKKFNDMLDTYWGVLYLISDNFKNVLETHSITGWSAYPVRVYGKKKEEILGYHGLSITGKAGAIDFSKSTIIEKQYVPNAPKARFSKGLHIGMDKWDGSDIFLPKGYLGAIMTKKVADIIKANKITNVELVNIADVEVPLIG